MGKAEVYEFATIEEGIEEIRAGRLLLIVDDKDRENECDLLMAAEKVTPEAINFMTMHGRGLPPNHVRRYYASFSYRAGS